MRYRCFKGVVYYDKGKNRPIFRFFFLTKYDSYIKLNETVIFIICSSICKKIFKSKYSKLPSWHSFKRRSVFFRCPNGVHEISRLGDLKQKKKNMVIIYIVLTLVWRRILSIKNFGAEKKILEIFFYFFAQIWCYYCL